MDRPTDSDKRYARLLAAFTALQQAAQEVVDENDRMHDNRPWPVKYAADFAAITKLRQLLAKQYGLSR